MVLLLVDDDRGFLHRVPRAIGAVHIDTGAAARQASEYAIPSDPLLVIRRVHRHAAVLVPIHLVRFNDDPIAIRAG